MWHATILTTILTTSPLPPDGQSGFWLLVAGACLVVVSSIAVVASFVVKARGRGGNAHDPLHLD
ncbi:MAG: hypothetical protein AB7K09_20425 [Planctomycetota bacterium]